MEKTYAAISDQALVDLTRQLIAIPSPNFEEGAVADFIGERMARTGMDVQMMPVEHPDQPGKVTRQPIGRLRGAGGGPTLMFNGHLDVAAMMPGWSVDPLKGKFEDGWIWGHGAQDDKGGLAAALVGIEAIVATGIRLKGDLLYCPVATHKLGGTGTRVMLKKGVQADYCINIEHSANTIGSVIVGSIRVKIRTSTPGLFFRFTKEARDTYFNSIEQQVLCLQAFGPSLQAVPEGSWLTFERHPELRDFPMIRHDAIHKDHYGRWCELIFQIRTVPGMTLASVRSDVARVIDGIKKRSDDTGRRTRRSVLYGTERSGRRASAGARARRWLPRRHRRGAAGGERGAYRQFWRRQCAACRRHPLGAVRPRQHQALSGVARTGRARAYRRVAHHRSHLRLRSHLALRLRTFP
jgi:acetylornithine deacetylase